ncbi:MAG: M42 family peptidase, partial [Ruminococcus sp.]
MNLTALLQTLTALSGVSGREADVCQPLLDLLKPYCPDAAQVQGNVIGTFGKRETRKPHVLLDAHFDQVG